MRKLVERITATVKRLEDVTEQTLSAAENSARIKRPTDRRHSQDRRRGHAQDIIALREEFEDLKLRVERNAHALETQFVRIAEIQAELSRLTQSKPPRFKG